jgi:hypothetical protein
MSGLRENTVHLVFKSEKYNAKIWEELNSALTNFKNGLGTPFAGLHIKIL